MYLRERNELREDRAYDCGCNSWSPLRDAVGSFRKELVRLWNSILPEPGQPSAQLSKLMHLTACKKTKHTVSRWYMTVYIPWLVASYDMHKGKRWLNSDPSSHRDYFNLIIFQSIDCGIIIFITTTSRSLPITETVVNTMKEPIALHQMFLFIL